MNQAFVEINQGVKNCVQKFSLDSVHVSVYVCVFHSQCVLILDNICLTVDFFDYFSKDISVSWFTSWASL